jgi:hypothetical protein
MADEYDLQALADRYERRLAHVNDFYHALGRLYDELHTPETRDFETSQKDYIVKQLRYIEENIDGFIKNIE